MTPEQIEFTQREAKGQSGQLWLAIFKALVHQLYNSKGKTLEQVVQDQSTALYLERELVARMDVAADQPVPDKNNQYL